MGYSSVIKNFHQKNPFFNFAYNLVKKRTYGEVFLIGGMVYRPIINYLYGIPIKNTIDYDFLIESENNHEIELPVGWEISKTHINGYKITHGDSRIDYISIDQRLSQMGHDVLASLPLDQKLKKYLSIVPLSLQSIYFNIKTSKLDGQVSLDSIRNKKIYVNNHASCNEYCAMYNMSPQDYMVKKYNDLNFEYIL